MNEPQEQQVISKRSVLSFGDSNVHQSMPCTIFVDAKNGILGIRRVNSIDNSVTWTVPLADAMELIRQNL